MEARKTNIDEIAGFIEGRYTAWGNARSEKEGKWDEYYRRWRCIESTEDKTRSSEKSLIKIPATKNAIDTAHDHIFSIVFSREPFFRLGGRQLSDKIKAGLLEKYLEFLFYKEKFPSKFSQFVRGELIYGTAIGRVKANIITEQNIVYDEEEYDFAVEQLQINRPCFEPINIFDFFIDPSAKDINSAEGVIVRSRNRLEQLKKLERVGVISRVDILEAQAQPTQMNDSLRRRLALTGITPEVTSNTYETLEWWGWIPEDVLVSAGYDGEIADGGAEVFAIVCNGTTLKAIPNPFYTKERPFVSDCYEKVPDEFYGMGICEITESPQKALDATVRSRLDNKALAINQIFGINVKKLVAGQNLDIYAGKKFLVDGDINDAIKQFKIDDVTSGTYNESMEYERYIQEASGISKMLGGQPIKRGEMTATETSMLSSTQSQRIKAVVKSLEDNVVKEILRWYYQIILQFLDIPEMVKVQDADGIEAEVWITAEDIIGDYDFIPQGTTQIALEDKLGRTMQYLQVTANPIDAQLVNRPHLLKKVYKMLGFDDEEIALSGMPQPMAVQNAQGLKGAGSIPNEPQGMPPEGMPPAQMAGGMIG